MKRTFIFAIVASFISLSGFAQTTDGHEGHIVKTDEQGQEVICFPENDLERPEVVGFSANGMSRQKYNQVLNRIERIYKPIFRSKGLKLKIKRKWRSNTVNASARQGRWFFKRTRIVNMYGGLARHEEITPDGFALVACHEVGHHIGGAPKIPRAKWATNEGQSDYFATLKCLRKYFAEDDNINFVSNLQVPSAIRESCEAQFAEDQQAAICIRSTLAGKSVSNLFQKLRRTQRPVKVTTPDPTVVATTFHKHPAPQCRLDTYFAGALCTMEEETAVSSKNPNIGTCSRQYGQSVGVRPLCWYKPGASITLAAQ